MGTDGEAGKNAEDGIDNGIQPESFSGKKGVEGGEDQQGSCVICGKRGAGSCFCRKPCKGICDRDIGGNDKGGA